MKCIFISFIIVFLLLVTISYAQEYTPDSNTVALWHFNEGSGNSVKDETGRFNGTISGAVWVDGKYGKALSFDGVNDAVIISSSSTEGVTNQITVEAWIYPTKTEGRIIGRYGYGGLSYLLTLQYDGKAGFYIDSSSYDNSGWSNSTIPLNTWTHVAATYDGSAISIYINGVLDSTTPKSLGNIISTTIPITIGTSSLPDLYFGGIIDEVRITTTAPSPTTTTSTPTTTTVPQTTTTQPNLTTTTIATTTSTTTIPSNQTNQTNQTTTTTIPTTSTTTTVPINQTTTTTLPSSTSSSTTTTTVPAPQNLSCTLDSECVGKITCPQVIGNDTERCITNMCQCGAKLVDKTVLLGLLIQMETMKTSFASMNSSATALLDYYNSINDTLNAERWSNITVLLGNAITAIDDIESYINTVKDAPTQADIDVIRNKIGDILIIVDKMIEVILGG